MAIKRTPRKEPKAKKAPKIKTCEDCKLFPHYDKSLDLYSQYFYGATAGDTAKANICFIMSPADFKYLRNKNWSYMITQSLKEYNVLFLPYQRCWPKGEYTLKHPISVHRICKQQHLIKELDHVKEQGFEMDLLVIFPDTKKFLSVDDKAQEIKFPGNWSMHEGTRVYLSKKFYDIEQTNKYGRRRSTNPSLLKPDALMHTVTRINKYFDEKLSWQKKQNFFKVQNMDQLNDAIEKIKQQDSVAVDVETTGLNVNEEGFALTTIGIYWPGEAVCIGYEVEECLDIQYRTKVKEFLIDLLADESVIKVCHNLKYEMKVFMAKLDTLKFESCEDTMFLSYLLDENRAANSLKFLAGEFLDGYPEIVEDFANATFDDLFSYNCLDCLYTFKLWSKHLNYNNLEYQDDIEFTHYCYREVMLPLCFEIALLEKDGVKIDYDYLANLEEELKDDLAEIKASIHQEFPMTRGRNLGSPKQLAEILFDKLKRNPVGPKSEKSGQYSTNKSVLKELSDRQNCGLSKKILERRTKAKQLSTYVTPYLEKREQYDGYVRSNYQQVKNFTPYTGEAGGTITGRLSSAGPCLQNIPARNKAIKKMFIPEVYDGSRVILQGDLSQAELRIGASLANEVAMLKVYNEGGDVHMETGLILAPEEELAILDTLDEIVRKEKLSHYRTIAKAANFGLIYGGSHLVLQRILKDSYSIEATEEQCMEMREAFFVKYPRFLNWHALVKQQVVQTKKIASPFGRIRHFPDIDRYYEKSEEYSAFIRQAINSPVQGACADFLAEIWTKSAAEIRRIGLDARAILTVHDSLIWDCNKKCYEDIVKIHKDVTAERTEFHKGWLKCPMAIDFEVGPNWGSLEEIAA